MAEKPLENPGLPGKAGFRHCQLIRLSVSNDTQYDLVLRRLHKVFIK